jgi:hypothetical protein
LRWTAGADADSFYNSMKFRKFIGPSTLAPERPGRELLNHELSLAPLVLLAFAIVRYGFFSGTRSESVSNPPSTNGRALASIFLFHAKMGAFLARPVLNLDCWSNKRILLQFAT